MTLEPYLNEAKTYDPEYLEISFLPGRATHRLTTDGMWWSINVVSLAKAGNWAVAINLSLQEPP